MSDVEFHVWNEALGHISGPFDSRDDAEDVLAQERKQCARSCGFTEKPGMDVKDFECGALHPHGFFLQITEGGQDMIHHDYGQYR
jgi:hypothetical protein